MSRASGTALMGMVAAKDRVLRNLRFGDDVSVLHLVVAGKAHFIRHRADGTFKALRRRAPAPNRDHVPDRLRIRHRDRMRLFGDNLLKSL